MEASPTTNPAPPSGVIPTEVPLGITSTTVPVPGPSDLIIKPLDCFRIVRPIFHSIVNINSTQPVGAQIFHLETMFPLGNFSNRYNTIAGNFDTLRPLVPWMLVEVYFSKFSKIDFEYHFTPIKVADCRVSLDIITIYDNLIGGAANYTTSTMNNDLFHKNLDSQDDELSLRPPMYWVSKFVQTDSTYKNFAGVQSIVQPGNLPTTQVIGFIRSPYHPSLIQPIDFDVLITVVPIVSVALQIAGKSATGSQMPDLWEQIPRPWFLHSAVN